MNKFLKNHLVLVLIILLSAVGCKEENNYGKILFFIDGDLFDNIPEFLYEGKALTSEYTGIDALFTYTFDSNNKDAAIDYSYDFGGERFSSLEGEASFQGPQVVLGAPKKSERNDYELRPTGISDDPFLVFDLSEDDGGSGSECGNYSGPEFNIQIDSQCKTAQIYLCAGNSDGVTVACGLYKQYQAQDSSIPNCPYCK